MSSFAWFPFFPGDYVIDTAELSLEQHGAYLLLLLHAYRNGGSVDANASVLHRLCRCTSHAERIAVDAVAARFFVRDGDRLVNRRAVEVLAHQEKTSKSRALAATARWERSKADDANASANASVLHMHQSKSQSQSNNKNNSHPVRDVGVESPREGAAPKPKRKTATVRPPDFAPGDTHRRLAAEQGVHLDSEWQKFCDHHDARASRFVDWPAALRTWIRNARAFAPRVNGVAPDDPRRGSPSPAARKPRTSTEAEIEARLGPMRIA